MSFIGVLANNCASITDRCVSAIGLDPKGLRVAIPTLMALATLGVAFLPYEMLNISFFLSFGAGVGLGASGANFQRKLQDFKSYQDAFSTGASVSTMIICLKTLTIANPGMEFATAAITLGAGAFLGYFTFRPGKKADDKAAEPFADREDSRREAASEEGAELSA